ncbi:hypothetical protein Taro_045527 [Colocasia esculenta]|uniref:Uncharacterized protein n=1 Tax=Colocasia esculenta TaxID=4460 RepID=A0A843WRI8_COLES|nr:hypothetical protein [Colocasia esculenta]
MMERMKFAHDQIWDTKSKLNVSLPYAHLLTRIFNHFGVNLSGAVVEKMGQSIRSRNLKKSGFSVQNGIWTKTSVAEGEAIIGDIPEIPEEAAELAVAAAELVAVESTAAPTGEAVAGVADSLPTSRVASVLREVLDSVPSTSVTSEDGGLTETEAMAPGHIERSNAENSISEEPRVAQGEVVMDEAPTEGEKIASVSQVSTSVAEGHIEMVEAPSQVEPIGSEPQMSESVAEGHSEDVVLEEAPTLGEQENVVKSAPIQGEQELGNEEAPSQGEPIENAPINEGPSTGHGDFEEPVPQRKIKRVVHIRQGKSHRKVNLKPVMEILKAQGDILSSVQSSVQGILASQATATSELSSVRNAMRWFNKELADMKTMLSVISRTGGLSPSATQSRPATVPRPPGPPAQESGPSGPLVQASGPSGPSAVVSQGQEKGKEPVAATKAPETSTLATPIPSSPSSSSTAPPAPPTFKHPMPRTHTSSSIIPSQHSFSPTPSHTSAPSSPSPSTPLTETTPVHSSTSFNPKHLFHPPTHPSSVTFILDKPQIHSVFDTNLPDDFERNTLISILSIASHVHKTDPPSPAKKKRKHSSSVSIPSSPLFPPLWYSLTLEPPRRSIYREYLQKCILSTIYGIPFLTLSEHLNIVLPLSQLTHFQKSKIYEGTEFKTEEQWANVKGNKSMYSKYLAARTETLTHRDHPLTLSEWFILQHKTSWGPFILKEIRIAKNFQLYSDFCYLSKLPEVQFYQFHSAIVMLRSEHSINLPLTVDFANLQVDSPVLLPKLHSLVFDSDAGSHVFDMFAKQMGRMSAKQGRMSSFLRFIFREYHSGRISSQVLAPLISECERLSPTVWETLYKEPHLQLQAINSSLIRQAKPILSAEAFMDLNSINPVQEIYVQWAARYTAFYALKKDLLDQKIFYPISLDRFLHRASFGKSTYFRFILDRDQYEEFLEEQRQLYIQRITPAMGSSFSVAPGVFHQTFEDMEIKAWAVISQHASLLSPLYYLTPN